VPQLFLEIALGRDAPFDALPRHDPDLNLRHVEPGGMDGGMVECDAPQYVPRLRFPEGE